MALIGEKMASDVALNEVLCICSGRRPEKTGSEGLTYKGPSYSMMTAKTSVDFAKSCRPSSSEIHL